MHLRKHKIGANGVEVGACLEPDTQGTSRGRRPTVAQRQAKHEASSVLCSSDGESDCGSVCKPVDHL
jgi:hypothetical protein